MNTITGTIPANRRASLEEAIVALNKRATKLGLPAVTVEFGEGRWVPEPTADDADRKALVFDVTIIGADVHLDGWTLVAAVDVIDAATGYVVVRSRSEERPEWRQNAGRCDHCGLARKRAMTVVVRHSETGEEKMVGGDCIKDMLPTYSRNLANVLAYHEMLTGLLDGSDEDETNERGSRGPDYIEPADLLPTVAEIVLHHGGYVSARTAEQYCRMSTCAEAMHHRYGKKVENRITPSDEAVALAAAAIEWAKAVTPDSDFVRNISAIATAGYALWRHSGLVAAIVPAYQRAVEQRVRQERQRASREASRHVGTVGEKLTTKVSLLRVVSIESDFGVSALHIFADESGNILKWFCSGARPDFPTDGTPVVITGTVKAHTVRDGTQETALLRVKIGEPKAKKSRKTAA